MNTWLLSISKYGGWRFWIAVVMACNDMVDGLKIEIVALVNEMMEKQI